MSEFNPDSDEYNDPTVRYNNLKHYFDKHPEKFLERIGKGPPCEYRWLAWKVISGVMYSQIPGLYKELLDEANELNENEHDKLRQINLDLNRTFPDHPFFSDQQYGNIGQEKLKRALRAYAMYNKDVGYTQSINFLMGFFLMVNGGNDEEAFWLFVAITKKNQNFGMVGNFEGGLEGFYTDTFPLYHQFVYQFDKLFEQKLPKLKDHFDQIGYPAPVWLQKWFMTLFLYSFPLKLCIRLWDNLLVEGLVLIFKFPLAIMEILEPVLLKANFEEVNDILSNLRTCDDPDIDPKKAVLPNIERIINKARRVKLDPEELRSLKNEYLELQAQAANFNNIRQIKMLPQILEEDDIYEEVNKMTAKAHSVHGDDIEGSFEYKEGSNEKSLTKPQRPNSADLYNIGIKINPYTNEREGFTLLRPHSIRCRPTINTMIINVQSTKSLKGFRDSAGDSLDSASHLKLPPIFDNNKKKHITEAMLKNLNIETSFDLNAKVNDSVLYPKASFHRANKSVKNISDPIKMMRKQSLNSIKGPNQSQLNLPPFGSFAQSLGRFSSMQHFQHAHTDRDIMEEINEDQNESFDNFFFRNKFQREAQSIGNFNIRRFETEVPKLNYTLARSKYNDSKKEIDAVSYSAMDQLQESFQQANSDLFLESQKDRRLFQPREELELLDCSDSSSFIDDSPA